MSRSGQIFGEEVVKRPEVRSFGPFFGPPIAPQRRKATKHTVVIILFLPAVFKAGSMNHVFLKQIQCKHCGRLFYVCWSCWRGQRYCGDGCREAAMREAHREAQRRYRQTDRGRETHRQAERRRRMKKTVDDRGSTPRGACDNADPPWLGKGVKCCFCGVSGPVVRDFPRRGYGARTAPWPMGPPRAENFFEEGKNDCKESAFP